MFIRFSSQENIKTYTVTARIVQVHKDWPQDHGSWELLKVEMQFMYGPIHHYF